MLKDRLLTDSVLCEEFPRPVVVKNEHSYSSNKRQYPGSRRASSIAPGSDGDSVPSSPISSTQDDMETECYPCIPMQSASNQRNKSAKTSGLRQKQQQQRRVTTHQLDIGGGEMITLKNEPMDDSRIEDAFDEDDEDNNGAVDVVGTTGNASLLLRSQQARNPQQKLIQFARVSDLKCLLYDSTLFAKSREAN